MPKRGNYLTIFVFDGFAVLGVNICIGIPSGHSILFMFGANDCWKLMRWPTNWWNFIFSTIMIRSTVKLIIIEWKTDVELEFLSSNSKGKGMRVKFAFRNSNLWMIIFIFYRRNENNEWIHQIAFSNMYHCCCSCFNSEMARSK